MNSDAKSPNYDIEKVEGVLLEVAAELHPNNLSADQLARRIVCDPDDNQEIETAIQAIHSLCELQLFERNGEIVEPTLAALRAVTLLSA